MLAKLLSIIMAVGTVAIFINAFLLFRQRRREITTHTLDSVAEMAKTIREFRIASEHIQPYTKDTQQWYREVVEPYLDFLFLISLQIEHKLFKVDIIKRYNPQLETNYKRVKPYIEYTKEYLAKTDPQAAEEAWQEIEQLNKILGIDV